MSFVFIVVATLIALVTLIVAGNIIDSNNHVKQIIGCAIGSFGFTVAIFVLYLIILEVVNIG